MFSRFSKVNTISPIIASINHYEKKFTIINFSKKSKHDNAIMQSVSLNIASDNNLFKCTKNVSYLPNLRKLKTDFRRQLFDFSARIN